MTEFIKRHILLAIVIGVAYFINRFILSGAHQEMAFDNYVLYFLYGVYGLLCIPVIRRDIKDYKGKKRLTVFTPSLIALAIVFSFVCSSKSVRDLDKSPVVFTAYGMSDFNGMNIQFRRDGTYKLTEWVMFMAEFHRGGYRIDNDSLVTLINKEYIEENEDMQRLLKSNIFVIRTRVQNNELNAADTIKELMQVDNKHNYLENSTVFRIR